MDRTIILKLNIPTDTQLEVLHQTQQQFTTNFNQLCAFGWQNQLRNHVKLQRTCYYQLRQAFPTLPSQLVIAATHKSAEALKSAASRLKNGRKAKQPHSQRCAVRYDARTYWVKWDTHQLSLATTQGRLVFSFDIPPYAHKYLATKPPTASADLIYKKGQFWLHVVISLPDVPYTANGQVIGTDLGQKRPAVTSQRKFLGKRHWAEVDRKYFRIRRKLQSKGTKSAKRHLKQLAGRQQRFHRDCDHTLSKRIVQSVNSGAIIVIENLTHIRNRAKTRHGESRRRLHGWSFAQFRAFLTYKAEERGMRVVAIDPRYTSQTCSRCGYRSKANRRSQSEFRCGKCNYQLNADLNASYNIRDKHLASVGTPDASGLQSISLMCQPALVG
jgi:IS605 OrfB family transposase